MRIVPDDDDLEREVMTSLPRSRPTRRSSKRPDRPATAATSDAAPGQREPRRTPRPKPAAATPAPRRTPRPKPAAVADGAAATGAAPATPPDTATSAPPPRTPPRREPLRRKVPAAGYAAPSGREEEPASPVHELVTTTVLAASELAQIGFDVGRSAVRSFIDRLPKP